MHIGNKVALYFMFLKLMVGTGPTFRGYTVVMPAASEKNVYQLLIFFVKNRAVTRIMSVVRS